MKHPDVLARSRYVRWSGLVKGGLAATVILLAVGLFKPSSIQPPGLGMSGSDLGAAPRKQVGNWYFRTEQWRADARTLVAAARWCLEVNPTTNPGTNLSAGPGLPNTNTAVISRT